MLAFPMEGRGRLGELSNNVRKMQALLHALEDDFALASKINGARASSQIQYKEIQCLWFKLL